MSVIHFTRRTANVSSFVPPLPARFIVKVQIPVMTNSPNPQALVYDEYRRVEQQFPISKELKAAMGMAHKRYFFAHMEGTELHLDEKTGGQSW